jgi:hypothetical protein
MVKIQFLIDFGLDFFIDREHLDVHSPYFTFSKKVFRKKVVIFWKIAIFLKLDLRDEGLILGESVKYKSGRSRRELSETVLVFVVAQKF